MTILWVGVGVPGGAWGFPANAKLDASTSRRPASVQLGSGLPHAIGRAPSKGNACTGLCSFAGVFPPIFVQLRRKWCLDRGLEADVTFVRFLKTSEAAGLLRVSPNTLRAWERRFGFPKPQRSPGRHRMYVHGEVVALRDALQDGLSISSAVSRAREGLSADTDSLQSALVSFDRERADAAIEASIMLRSVDRAIDETLLPAIDEVCRRQGVESAAWAFSARWASDWIRRATSLASPPARPIAVVLGEASRDELDPDFVHIRALELYCLRAGFRVLSLSARGVIGLGDAVMSHRPDIVVLAGGYLSDDAVARWAYAVRFAAGPLPVSVFRRGEPPSRAQGTGTKQLPSSARAALRSLLELSEQATQVRPAIGARRVVGP